MIKYLVISILLGATPAAGQEVQFVTKFLTSKLYLYDAAGEDIKSIKSKKLQSQMVENTVDGKTFKGLKILDKNLDEGLIAIPLAGHPDGVWIEAMAVEIEPGYQLDCPESVRAKPEVEKSGMTIGFGEHCKKKDLK